MTEFTLSSLPEIASAERLANEAHDIALSVSIDTPMMYGIAADELRNIAMRRKRIEELRMTLTRPLDESKKRIMDLFRAPTERLQEAEGILRRGMLTFQSAEQRKADEVRRDAEAKARAEREALELTMREAEKAGDAKTADEAAVALEIADVAPITQIVPATKAKGITTRENWKAEIVDLKALVVAAGKASEAGDDNLLGYLCADTKALGSVARALKGAARIPGVRIYCEELLSVRTA